MTRPTCAPGPAPAVLCRGSIRLRQVRREDAALLAQLWGEGENMFLALPDQASQGIGEAMIQAFQQTMWSAPLVAEETGNPFGFLAAVQADPYSQTAGLCAFFDDPRRGPEALRLYLRHLFWAYPFHRVSAQVPASCVGYVRLLEEAGFVHEGMWREHRLIAGERHDVAALGILRQELLVDLRANDPDLAW